jgi:hypothetical protein
MTKFSYSDIVTTTNKSIPMLRAGDRSWVVGISHSSERSGAYLNKFPEGVVYTIEFEDGSSIDVEEKDLLLLQKYTGPAL